MSDIATFGIYLIVGAFGLGLLLGIVLRIIGRR